MDFHELELLGKKHFKLIENLEIDHLDNSFIYKYISEVKEYLEYGKSKSLKKYKKETPGQVVEDKIVRVIEWLASKMNVAYSVAEEVVTRAQSKGITPDTLQQKWNILSPTLISLVADYKPKNSASRRLKMADVLSVIADVLNQDKKQKKEQAKTMAPLLLANL